MEELKVSGGSTQFIVIKLGDEQYGIDIKYIENIVRCSTLRGCRRLTPI